MQQVLPDSNAMISLLVIPLSYLLITFSLNSGWRARPERGQSPEKKYCRPAKPVCKPVALKATGNQSNESNYSETGRTDNPFARALPEVFGHTTPVVKYRPQPVYVSCGTADQ